MIRPVLAVTVALIAATTVARAQPDPAPDPAPVPPAVVPAPPPAAPSEGGPRWLEWKVQGTLLESEDTVRALLATTMNEHPTLGPTAREAIGQAAEVIGYHLIGLGTSNIGGKIVAVLSLAPIPVVRSVVVTVDQGLIPVLTGSPLLDDQVLKRLRIRVGARLPWDPQLRANALRDETRRIEDYLHDEGFFDAKVTLSAEPSGTYGLRISVEVEIGPEYTIDKGRVTIETGGGQGVAPAEIKAQFSQQKECLVWRLCFGRARFTRARHTAALTRVTELYRKRGFPAVRVQSDFDPKTSFDRRTKTVRFTVRVDERREIDVVFEGNDKGRFPDDVLRKQLTFDEAASSDDFEAASSAAALVAYYQSKGKFDAQVTVDRVRFTAFDRIVFRIDEGDQRQVRSVSFAGNHEVSTSVLAGVVTTRVYRAIRILGSNPTATATVLTDDADRIRAAYTQRGFLEARAGGTPLDQRGASGLDERQVLRIRVALDPLTGRPVVDAP